MSNEDSLRAFARLVAQELSPAEMKQINAAGDDRMTISEGTWGDCDPDPGEEGEE